MTSLASRLAADRGLERVYGAGDHASDVAQPDFTAFSAAVAATPGQKERFGTTPPPFTPCPRRR